MGTEIQKGQKTGAMGQSRTHGRMFLDDSFLVQPATFFYKTAREDAKNQKLLTQNVQKIQDTMRRPNLRIIGIEEGEEYQLRGTVNIFNKIVGENFPTFKNEMTTERSLAYLPPGTAAHKG